MRRIGISYISKKDAPGAPLITSAGITSRAGAGTEISDEAVLSDATSLLGLESVETPRTAGMNERACFASGLRLTQTRSSDIRNLILVC